MRLAEDFSSSLKILWKISLRLHHGSGKKVQRLSKVQQVISLLTFLSILLTRINRVAFEQ